MLYHQCFKYFLLTSSFSCSIALALPFSIDAIEGDFSTDISFTSNWSTQKPNHHFVGQNNGGRAFSTTHDNNRLNFKRGDNFSRLLKVKHKLQLKYEETGIVLSGQYWYDYVAKNQHQPFKNISDRGRYVSDRAAGAQWQQAFIYQNYQIKGKQGTVRLGNQLLNWGEGQLISGGINVINPMDYREGWRYDMDLQEERVPVSLLSFSQQLTDQLSTEFFYQLDWKSNSTGNCNSFFAPNDYIAHGCVDNLRVLRSNTVLSAADMATLNAAGINTNSEGVLIRRGKDQKAKRSGQFGINFQYFFEPFKTDIGIYFINYHSRTGFVNGRMPSQQNIAQANALGALAPEWLAGHSSYFINYPENIHLYGLTLNKDITGDFNWRAELSYRPNMPIQINQIELFNVAIGQPSTVSANPSQTIKGYERKKLSQFQTSFTKTSNEIMGAKEFKFTSVLGMSYLSGLGSTTYYGREAVFGSAYNCTTNSRYCEKKGFTTRFAWGYRLHGEWLYTDVLPRLDLKPNINWLHDVKGYSPSNEAVFIEGRKAITFGVTAEYLKTYYTAINYTNFFGGRYNLWQDRDFINLQVGIKF